MSLLLKKLNQASAQKTADESAEKSAESSQPQGAQPQESAGVKPPAPAVAATTAATATAPPVAPAGPAAAPTPAQPTPGSPGLKSAAPSATPAPAPAGATATAATAPKPKTAEVRLETAATAAADAAAAKPQAAQQAPGARKLSRGLRSSEYFSKARGIVSAARVFGAQSNEKGNQLPKIIAAAAVVVAVAGGGIYAYLQFASGGIGESVVNVQARQGALAQQAADAITIPSPAVDVQAQIAALGASASADADDAPAAVIISGEEAIAGYEIAPDVQYSEEEWSLIEREEREAAEAEEQETAIIFASEAEGVEVGREIAIQIESQRDDIELPDDSITVHAVHTDKVVNRAAIKTSERALRRAEMLSQAADLYAAGQYQQAGGVYGEVLRETPSNLQALRGSALVAAAQGRHKSSAEFYVKILEFFPEDPLAVAELANLGGINPAEVERLLRTLLGKTPAIDGRLYFALGNVYAASSRWRKARDAFGDALSRERNPDYAYNLAVAMEYLGETELAAHYYRQALQMAQGSITAGFDADKVKARIAVLGV